MPTTLPVAPTALPPLPTPPTMADPVNFDARADASVQAQYELVPLLNVELGKVFQNATSAKESADATVTVAGDVVQVKADVLAARDAAAASAASAANAPGTSATSTTALTVGAGDKTLVLAQTGKLFSVGQTLILARAADPAVQMVGVLTAFVSNTGAATVAVPALSSAGVGTFSDWVVSLAPPTVSTPAIAAAAAAAAQPQITDQTLLMSFFLIGS